MSGKVRNILRILVCCIYTVCVCAPQSQAALQVQNFNALYSAASNRRIEIISRALARGLDIDSIDSNGNTGLCVAIRRNDYTAYQVFSHFGANQNHSCITRIPRYQYSRFMASVPRTYQEYTSASSRYAKLPVQNSYNIYSNNLYGTQWYKSPWTWTIGGLAIVGGGIALASGGGGGGSKKAAYASQSGSSQPLPIDVSDLSGVDTPPIQNKDPIYATVTDSEDVDLSTLWGIYSENNDNIINLADINVTTNGTYNQNHWGGIYAKNGYIANAGVITITSDNYYAAGLMACIVNSYNPANTACFVNENNTMVGDIYNTGTIDVTANQSSGIFSSNVRKITNAGTIKMRGEDNTGIFIYGNAENVTNTGEINIEGIGSDYLAGSMNGIWASQEANITNKNKITIDNSSSTDANYIANGIYSKAGTVTNDGTVDVQGNGAALKTNEGTLINNETITINNHDNNGTAYGMKVDYTGAATNNKDIEVVGTGYGMYVANGTLVNSETGSVKLYGNGYALAGNGTNINNGEIISLSGGMIGNNVINNGEINSSTTGLSTDTYAENNGTIYANDGIYGTKSGNILNTGTISATNTGTFTQEGSTTNSGTITSEENSITTMKGNISNSGTITSHKGSAIDTAQSIVTNEENAVISSGEGGTESNPTILSQYKEVTDADENVTSYSPNLTINNAGTISLSGAGTVIKSTGDDSHSPRLVVNNASTGVISINNQNGTGKLVAIDANFDNMDATISNEGSIIINDYNTINENEITGITVKKGTVTNDGSITITNNYFPTSGDTSRDKKVIGVLINEGTATNNGTITINANNAIGMLAEYEGEEPEDDEVKVTVTNNGTIEMNGTNNIAMYANNKGSVITNAGTIIIKKPNMTDIYQKYGDTVYDETSECNSFICLTNGGTYVNSGTVISQESINFNQINGRSLLSTGSRISAPQLSGVVYANYDLVTGSFEDTYTTDEDSLNGDTSELEIRSISPLFTAQLTRSLSPLRSGISLTRKSFYHFTNNPSVAQYLESNYQQGNNIEFFDNLKVTDTNSNVSHKIDQSLGLKLFPSFSKQVLDNLKNINSDISNSLFLNDKDDDIRTTVGFNTHYRKYDKTQDLYGYEDRLQSLFGVTDKKVSGNWRVGIGINYAMSDTKYDENNKRKNNLIQFFAPFIYYSQESLYHFMSTPRAGFLWGKYKHQLENEQNHATTKEFYYGITNELHRDIAFEKFILEPNAELNFAGLYIPHIKEKGLLIGNHNDISLEIGIGLYLKKKFEFNNHNSLSFRLGGSIYQELLNPYASLYGSLEGMSGKYKLNQPSVSKTRSVLKTTVKYQQGQLEFLGNVKKYIEDTDGYEVDLNMQYNLQAQ